MKRFHGNPILKPLPHNRWESRRVFNAAALNIDNKVHILYRAMGNDNISRIGYASSSDGFNIEKRLPFPVFVPKNDKEQIGCEDPRLTLIKNKIFMTYTAFNKENHHYIYQVSLTSINVEDFIQNQWSWGERLLPFPGIRNKDAVLFPKKNNNKYIMFHRIEPDICVSYSNDLKRWYDLKAIIRPRVKTWDCLKVGAAGPPIILNEGLLFIYHGVDFNKVYSLGVLLLDKHNPEKILYRSQEPILKPEEDYELYGEVPNVVFSCGNVIMDGQLFLYYGGADTALCLATCDINELLPKK